MFRRILIVLVSFSGVSAKAEEILVKISNRLFSVSVSDNLASDENISSNQLIDLFKSAQNITQIKVLPGKKGHIPGAWTDPSARPGSWTETSAKTKSILESDASQSGQ